MRRVIPASLAILCVALLVVTMAALRAPLSTPVTGTSELSVITNTIRSAFLTRGQACMAQNYAARPTYEAALNGFWSAATPEPARVATLAVRWAQEAPTLPPAVYAEIVATANAEYAAGIIDEKTYQYSIDPSEPTPNWNPNDTPRDGVPDMLDSCYGKPGYVDFGVERVYDPNITITGDTAEGTIQIAWWAKVTDGSTAVYDRQHDDRYFYVLEKHSSGAWKIVNEAQDSGRQGP